MEDFNEDNQQIYNGSICYAISDEVRKKYFPDLDPNVSEFDDTRWRDSIYNLQTFCYNHLQEYSNKFLFELGRKLLINIKDCKNHSDLLNREIRKKIDRDDRG